MDVIADFASRRRKVLKTAVPWIVVGGIGTLISASLFKDSSVLLSKIELVFIVGSFLTCIIIGAIIVLRVYRCPVCNNVPAARHGLLFGLKKCPSCGTRLK